VLSCVGLGGGGRACVLGVGKENHSRPFCNYESHSVFLLSVVLPLSLFGSTRDWTQDPGVLGNHSAIQVTPSVLSLLVCFWDRISLTMPRLALNCDLPDSASQVAGTTGLCHCTQLLLCVVLVFELWVLWLLGKCSSTWARVLVFFALGYFLDRIFFFSSDASLYCDPSVYSSP
jgi:hypothetical protein